VATTTKKAAAKKTAKAVEPDDAGQREPSTSEATEPDAAPVEAPTAKTGPGSSADGVQAASGGHSSAGEVYHTIVDGDGSPLGADDLFDESDQRKTYVVSTTRVYEQFFYPGAKQPSKRLLFAQGRHVPRDKAERLKAAIKAHS
jgi:hypothetical protein